MFNYGINAVVIIQSLSVIAPVNEIPLASIILLALYIWRIAMHVSAMLCGTETSRKNGLVYLCAILLCT